MNFPFLIVGILSVVFGIIMMVKHKFYKYKSSDMLFAAKLKVFSSSAILVLFGIMILINELKKLVN
ncbi:hypothetical protein OC25_07850 [Pedobacter kyungheensis]|uniref:Uncharacterized protein n=1 Tax=Pedobacter kyungheensis TaxID=1069985 RepID=A0A0C1DC98_9SPHI|nr:hypothetical protein OC25_07850 [Pedobacter kyungheensis]